MCLHVKEALFVCGRALFYGSERDVCVHVGRGYIVGGMYV